jgi:oligogalacturonide transport system permease protein
MNMKSSLKNNREGYFYIAPWVIGFLVFGFYPLITSLYYSFTNFGMFNKPHFIGFKNYIYMFTEDPDFLPSLLVTFKYVLFSVPLKIVSALFFAMLLNRNLKFINVFTTVYYLPSILGSSVAISILWRFIFSTSGVINNILSRFHMQAVPFLEHPKYALFTVSLLVVWSFGSSMVIFLAGLKQIPKELYEACDVDGASKVREFFTITFPLITPSLFFNIIMQMINSFQSFTSIFVITHGGPMKSTYVYMMKLYDDAFANFKMGYASALSWVLFIIILVITSILFTQSNKHVYYME